MPCGGEYVVGGSILSRSFGAEIVVGIVRDMRWARDGREERRIWIGRSGERVE